MPLFIQKKLVPLLKKPWFPFLLLTLLMGALHCFLPVNQGDDVFFSEALGKKGLFAYLKFRYLRWTSRLLIETVLVTAARFPLLWRVLDVGFILLLAYSISRLIGGKRPALVRFLACAALLVYPFLHQGSAGWIATTVNYIWPSAALLFALIPCRDLLLENRRPSRALADASVAALLFACNAEQCCAVACGVLLIFNVLLLVQKKRRMLPVAQLLLSLASLLFILTVPGNASRTLQEAAHWFPSFPMLSLTDKLYMGFSNLSYYVFTMQNRLFFLLCLIELLLVFHKKRPLPCKLAGLYCTGFTLLMNLPRSVQAALGLVSPAQGLPSVQTVLSITPNLLLFLSLLCIALCALLLLCAADTSPRNLLLPMIYLAGIASAMMLVFSPTIYASGFRTLLLLDIGFMLLFVLLAEKSAQLIPLRKLWPLWLLVTFFAFQSYLHTFSSILA